MFVFTYTKDQVTTASDRIDDLIHRQGLETYPEFQQDLIIVNTNERETYDYEQATPSYNA